MHQSFHNIVHIFHYLPPNEFIFLVPIFIHPSSTLDHGCRYFPPSKQPDATPKRLVRCQHQDVGGCCARSMPGAATSLGFSRCHFKWYWNCLGKDFHTLFGGVLVFWHISYCNARYPPLCSPLSFQHKGHYDRQCHNTHQQETPGCSHQRGLELSPKGSVDHQGLLEDATLPSLSSLRPTPTKHFSTLQAALWLSWLAIGAGLLVATPASSMTS